ncbi:MAG: 50S ribosomal protein L30 [Deltaproteobacteria bacterium]|jgi:large subunit ribosomal protein L30|nr:50S ribosomal protein L30 [Deltaproteobacteria bacterium]MBW2529933.1 50S ribosomal protein L30 [Deltaproteobacteria bacterium]
MSDKLRVRQTRSEIGHTQRMRRVLKGLGLRGIGSEVVVANTPSFRGMVKKVMHLVSVEEVSASATQAKAG